MLSLPRVKKSARRALSQAEKAQKVVVGVALALGITLAGLPASDANASAAPTQVAQFVQPASGAMLLSAPAAAGEVLADHFSHSSHASHASHASHHSHFSSSY